MAPPTCHNYKKEECWVQYQRDNAGTVELINNPTWEDSCCLVVYGGRDEVEFRGWLSAARLKLEQSRWGPIPHFKQHHKWHG